MIVIGLLAALSFATSDTYGIDASGSYEMPASDTYVDTAASDTYAADTYASGSYDMPASDTYIATTAGTYAADATYTELPTYTVDTTPTNTESPTTDADIPASDTFVDPTTSGPMLCTAAQESDGCCNPGLFDYQPE